MTETESAAFPLLAPAEIDLLRNWASAVEYDDGDIVFRAGQADIDFHVVERGSIEIVNPMDDNRVIAVHGPGGFAGDIDLLTGRPVIVTGIARGPTTVLRTDGKFFRHLLNRLPSLSEKLITALALRRELLSKSGAAGLRVLGPGTCRNTNLIREFLHKNFVPHMWLESESEAGKQALAAAGSPPRLPVVVCGDGRVIVDPTVRELAIRAGVWKHCPDQSVDLAIVGGGPAGITAAVYASSEGLSSLVLDRLGPGGQAGGSSRIENFIGFPAGLSGAELATRGVLQMLKFGAQMVAPVAVERIMPVGTNGDRHALLLDCGAQVTARVVLLATGVRLRRLGAEGAARFENAGIFYACTTVEADLCDQSDVAVVGGGNSAGQAVMFLAESCVSRTVHLVHRGPLGATMSDYLANRVRAARNVVIHERHEIERVEGKRSIEGVVVRSNAEASEMRLPCTAVFVFIGADPCVEWLPPAIARDAQGFLLTGTEAVRSGLWRRDDRDPCPLETTLPGVLAAGDIRAGSAKRVAFAVGDGALAVTCAQRLLSIAP